jgi:hypothetical protein
MKKALLILVPILVITLLYSFRRPEQEGNAIVEKRSGLDVYVFSRPVKPYDVVSSEKFTVAMDCNEIFNKPVKKSQGKGDGVIIYPETSRYDIIKYKK